MQCVDKWEGGAVAHRSARWLLAALPSLMGWSRQCDLDLSVVKELDLC